VPELECRVRPQVDDIFAALILSLVMLRRLEVKTTSHEQNPHVAPDRFDAWRRMALRAYAQAAVACTGKVLLNLGWMYLATKLGLLLGWLQLGGVLIFFAWIAVLVWAWKIGTDARHLRLSLGIRLRREARAA
jgi:hypothetical protein